jgi:hypothetical protein
MTLVVILGHGYAGVVQIKMAIATPCFGADP